MIHDPLLEICTLRGPQTKRRLSRQKSAGAQSKEGRNTLNASNEEDEATEEQDARDLQVLFLRPLADSPCYASSVRNPSSLGAPEFMMWASSVSVKRLPAKRITYNMGGCEVCMSTGSQQDTIIDVKYGGITLTPRPNVSSLGGLYW
jgi:hypothetical protein